MKIVYLLFISIRVFSQDANYIMKIGKELCSKKYAGRSYNIYPGAKTRGIENAKTFIIDEIKNTGALDLSKYVEKSKKFSKKTDFQKLTFSDNAHSEKIVFTNNNIVHSSLKINGKVLLLGKDYLPDASVPSVDFSGILTKIDSVHYMNKEKKIIFQLEKKLMYSASQAQENYVMVYIKNDILNTKENNIQCDLKITSKLEEVQTENIYCFVPGTLYPDSFIVLSAHYDHLGNIDTTYFPGANDNASGVAVLLDFMQYFKKHPQKYSIAFYFFTGEEIGLLGSKHYVEHPLFDLKRIKFLINLDLMGGGSEGVMVVNGKVFQNEFELLEKINNDNHLNLILKSRGKAQNSDHYWFTESGVKSFFIYTLGDITAYHDIDDKSEALKFSNYHSIFQLIAQYISSL